MTFYHAWRLHIAHELMNVKSYFFWRKSFSISQTGWKSEIKLSYFWMSVRLWLLWFNPMITSNDSSSMIKLNEQWLIDRFYGMSTHVGHMIPKSVVYISSTKCRNFDVTINKGNLLTKINLTLKTAFFLSMYTKLYADKHKTNYMISLISSISIM